LHFFLHILYFFFVKTFILIIWATQFAYSGIIGTSGEESFDFTSLFESAKTKSYSNSNIASNDGLFSIRQNPSSLSLESGRSIYLNYGVEAEGFTNTSLGYSQEIFNAQVAVVFNLRTLNSPIKEIDDQGIYSGEDHRPWAEETHWVVNYSPIKGLKVGHGVHLLFSRLTNDSQDKTAWGLAFDHGLYYQASPKSIAWGIALNNLGKQYGGYYEEEDNWLQGDLSMGIRWRVPANPRISLSHNLIFPFFGEERFANSLEYLIHPRFKIVASASPSIENILEWIGQRDEDSLPLQKEWPFAGGFELNFAGFKLNYSINPHPLLSWHHQLSIDYTFFK
jgi:hypothetical protein